MCLLRQIFVTTKVLPRQKDSFSVSVNFTLLVDFFHWGSQSRTIYATRPWTLTYWNWHGCCHARSSRLWVFPLVRCIVGKRRDFPDLKLTLTGNCFSRHVHVEGSKTKEFTDLKISSLLIYMNTWWVPHLEMSPNRFTMATIALFSQSEQTHSALVVCHSEWVTVALHSAFWISCLNTH